MKALHLLAATLAILINTGCSTFFVKDSTTKEGHVVSVWRGNMLMNASVETADVNYGPVRISVGKFQQAGDAKTAKVIADGIIGGITAYYTAGASSVAKGVIKGMTSDSAVEAVAPIAGEICDPATGSCTLPVK